VGGYALGGWTDATAGNGGHAGNAVNGDGGNGHAGVWGSNNGDDGFVNGLSEAQASAVVDTSAFNQSIVQGANVLGNTVDMTVVGGGLTSTVVGDDDLA
jgi:hypothetical protein